VEVTWQNRMVLKLTYPLICNGLGPISFLFGARLVEWVKKAQCCCDFFFFFFKIGLNT
jgi:hypothetical protein